MNPDSSQAGFARSQLVGYGRRPAAQVIARSVLLLVAVALLAVSLQATAQQTIQQVRLVGLLVPNRLDVQPQYPVFVETLRKFGYREGDNLRFLTKEAGGKLDRLPSLARELVDARVSVIVAFNTPGARAAIDATRQIPIVVTVVGDPIGSGFVTNFARPGGNVTGVSNMSAELVAKRLEILKEVVPSSRRIAVLFNPEDPVTVPQVRDVQSAAATLSVEVRSFPVRTHQELTGTFTQVIAWQAHSAVWLSGQSQLFQGPTAKLAAQHKLPVMLNSTGDVVADGFISYMTDFAEIHQRTAAQVDRILKGTKPGDLPFEQPTKFELAINLNAAKMLGLTIPSIMLLRADHIVK